MNMPMIFYPKKTVFSYDPYTGLIAIHSEDEIVLRDFAELHLKNRTVTCHIYFFAELSTEGV